MVQMDRLALRTNRDFERIEMKSPIRITAGIALTAALTFSCTNKPAAPVPVDKSARKPSPTAPTGGTPDDRIDDGRNSPYDGGPDGSQAGGGGGTPQGNSAQVLGPTDIKIQLANGSTKIINWDISKGDMIDPSLQSTLSIR